MAGPGTGGVTSTNYDDIATTTITRRSRQLSDNLSNNTALMMRMKERGKIRTFSGGQAIVEELAYSGPGNFQMYSGYDTLGVSQGEMLTAAEFAIKQAAVAVSMSGLEQLQNAGPEQFIDLFAARLEQGEREMVNNLSDATNGIYSNGTSSGGKAIGGLQLIVSDAGTGTVGGIVSATYTWWLSKVYDFSTQAVTPSSATIQTAMNTLYLDCSRNRDQPDLIVADDVYYTYYWESLQANQRFTNSKLAEAGFDNLKFKGADVVPDGGINGGAPASHMYFLNTNFLHWRPHAKRNMVPLNPDRYAVNQDAFVKLIAFAGNMTSSGRQFQGAIVA